MEDPVLEVTDRLGNTLAFYKDGRTEGEFNGAVVISPHPKFLGEDGYPVQPNVLVFEPSALNR